MVKRRFDWKKLLLACALVAALAVVYAQGWYRYLTFESLKASRDSLLGFVVSDYLLALGCYVGVFVLAVTLFLPGVAVITISGGLLFGTVVGALWANLGASSGAVVAFLVTRYLVGDYFQRKYAARLVGFNRQVKREGWRYLLGVRFIPVFPFALLNIAAGLTRIPLRTFAWTTSLGIVPSSLLYAYAGTQLASIEDPGDILSPRMIAAMLMLAALALSPVVFNKLRKKK